MRFGAVFPQLEVGNDPGAIRAYAQTVEAQGYEHLIAYDHVLGADVSKHKGWKPPYGHEHAFHEPFVLFGFLAAATRRLTLMTGVIVLPQRQTALVAKQAAALDVLSGGRLRFGIGTGWNFVEYEALGVDFKRRGAIYDEQIQVLRALWQKPLVTFKGRFHKITAAGLNPLPVQRPIPLWFGGKAEVVIKRVAKWGEGWIPFIAPDDHGRAMIAKLHRYARQAKRKPTAIRVERVLRLPVHGPDSWVKEIEASRGIGITDIALDTQRAGLKNVDDHLRTLRLFSEAAARFND